MNDDLSPDLHSLFDAERRRDDVPDGAKDRVHAALAASLGVGLAGGTGIAAKGALAAKGSAAAAKLAGAAATSGTAAATTAAAASSAGAAVTATGGVLAKGLAFALVAAMAGTAGTGVYLAAKDSDKKPVVVEHAVPDVPDAFDPSVLGKHALAVDAKPKQRAAPLGTHVDAAHEQELPVDSAVVVEKTAAAAESPEERATRLAGERTVLDEARAAVARGDGGAALIALEAHRDRYPDGALVEEREALTVLALAKLGRVDEGRAKAARFRARFPASLMQGAIDAALPPE